MQSCGMQLRIEWVIVDPCIFVIIDTVDEAENYGSVLKDCKKALTINPKSSKAYYRAASALLALDRPEEALECCEMCLAYDTNNTGMRTLHGKVVEAVNIKKKKEQERQERLRKEAETKRIMNNALRVSGEFPSEPLLYWRL